MKTIQDIAKAVLERRNRMNPMVVPGEITAEIGSEGLQEALNRHWIEPNYDSGFLQVTNDLGVVEDIRKIAALPPEAAPSQQENASHSFSQAHANRQNLVEFVDTKVTFPEQKVTETLGLGGGVASSPSATPASVPPYRPQAPSTPTAPRDQQTQGIGDDVAVVENGQTYTGKIASMKDGKYTVSFGSKKPLQPRDYDQAEMRTIQPAQV